MKRKFKVYCILTLLAIILAALCSAMLLQRSKVGSFSLNDYTSYMEDFSSDSQVSPIHTPDDARRTAKEIWKGRYDKSFPPFTFRTMAVSFDENSRVWLVNEEMHSFFTFVGGTAHILIHEDGKVIAVWHDK